MTQEATAAARERSFLEAALDSVIMVDAHGRILEFNPSAEATFGYTRDQVLGRPLVELIVPPSLRERHQEAFDRFVRTREKRVFGQRIELAGMRADGTEFPIELALSLVTEEPLLIYGAVRDISTARKNREELERLAVEQEALRHVATLVATGASPTEVFSAVAEGVATVLSVPGINMVRFDRNTVACKVAGWGTAPLDVGVQWALHDPSVMALVAQTGRPARIDDYAAAGGPFARMVIEAGMRSGIGAPIVVDGETWGAIVAFSEAPNCLSSGAEERLARFTELVATAISNAQSQERLDKLLREQAGLRRVATLVARFADPNEVFNLVCHEVGQLLGAERACVLKCVSSDRVEIVAEWAVDTSAAKIGKQLSVASRSLEELVRELLAPVLRSSETVEEGLGRSGSKVGAPVIAGGELWGLVIAEDDDALSAGAGTTVASFAEMLATAVTNVRARSQLLASRARIVAAGDEARRRLQRDIHDGAQQRIVVSIIDLQLADEQFDANPMAAREGLRAALRSSQASLEELREMSSGLHPQVLTRGGLQGALDALATKSPIPVAIVAPRERYAPHLEAATYFVVAESLANVTKHAKASRVNVQVEERTGGLQVSIKDDGAGGADPERGTGLLGLLDRCEALGGHLDIYSPKGEGTLITASLPYRRPAL